MEKEEVLSNLYGLRAGLSMISEQKDEICKNKDSYANEFSDCEDEMIDAFCDIYQVGWGTVQIASLRTNGDYNSLITKLYHEPILSEDKLEDLYAAADYKSEAADIIKSAMSSIKNYKQIFKYSDDIVAKYVIKKDLREPKYKGQYVFQLDERANCYQESEDDCLLNDDFLWMEIIKNGKIKPNYGSAYLNFAPWLGYKGFIFNKEGRNYESLSSKDIEKWEISDYKPYFKNRAKTVYRDQYIHYIESPDTQQQIDQYLATKPQTPAKVKKTTSALKVGIPAAILIAAVLAVIAFFVTRSIFDGNILGYIAGIGGSIIIGAIILCIAMIKNKSNYKRNSKESAQIADKANANLESGKASIGKYLAARQKYIEVKNNRSEYYSQNIVPYKTVGDAVYSALVTEYSSMLDPRDWKWIDLIIYYFETGRADNIRDALLLADKERRTQQVIASIKEASQNICTTLQDGFMMMQKTMIQCFDNLTNTINSGFNKLNGTIQQGIATNNSLMLANLNATRLQNSLLAKSNETSQQLMEDVHYIRMNAM